MSTAGRIRTLDELLTLYRTPSALVRSKVQPSLDPASQRFIEQAPFLLLSTIGQDGRLDVSPRGGPPGFVRVLPDGSIAVPDLNGNNLLDTLRAVVATGKIGMLFVHPGRDETVRVNGEAFVTVDPDLLDGFTAELRRPKSAIVVQPSEVFVHCAKAFRRGRVWQPESWAAFADAPDAVDILQCQLNLADVDDLRAGLQRGYDEELAED